MSKKLVVIDDSGTVIRTEYDYDISQHTPLSSLKNSLVVDSSVSPVLVEDSITETLTDVDGSPTGQTVTRVTSVNIISPATEQVLTGTVVGQFAIGEQVIQTHFIPTLVNGLTLYGTTANEYLPTVGSIGLSGDELGNRSLQFKGSYLDTNTKAAGVQLPSFSTTSSPYFMLSGFLYFESEPSNNYDPILLTRSADGVNSSTNDSFRLEYDTSSDQLQFHYSTASYASSGYQAILNVCPSNGVTLNQWHQFAVAYSNQGGCAAIASYWNGNRYTQTTGLSGNIRNSTGYMMIGSGASGDRPLKGWLEHLIISAGGASLALREFNFGTSAAVSTEQFAGDYTVYAMNMNGPLGTSYFPVANSNRVVSTVTWDSKTRTKLGVGNIVRETTSNSGTAAMFTGVCGGHAASGSSAGYLFGINSGACMIISAVEEVSGGASANAQMRSSLVDFSQQYLLGYTAMQGVSGGSGDFAYLLSTGQAGFSGTRFSFLPIDSNVAALKLIYDDITINGKTGPWSIADYNGTLYTFATAGVKALYQDVVSYRNLANTVFGSLKTSIASKTSVTSLRELGGVSTEGTLLKLAPAIEDNGGLILSGKAKVTKKTNFPETINKTKTISIPLLGDPLPIGEG